MRVYSGTTLRASYRSVFAGIGMALRAGGCPTQSTDRYTEPLDIPADSTIALRTNARA